MSKIIVMDELLANKIAAGEVIERCASVVKELVENSIDANSTEIKVELKEAGISEIKVIDNGNGMEREDAIISFDRHATSKIKTDNDLYNIRTLGFRGEALASIASVSRIVLKTATGNLGTIINLEGGKILNIKNGDSRKGTIIIVSNLFYNTPARLKHLKSLYTELAHITSYLNRVALSHPKIKFLLSNNGKVLLNTDGSGDRLKVIKEIYGLEVVKRMKEIKGSNNDYEIFGYISLPELSRSSRNHIITIVNGRVIKNYELNKIINDSYHTYKFDNQFPIVVLNIKVDPILIDVNIHPTKQDIMFSKKDSLFSLIKEKILEILEGNVLIPSGKIKLETNPIYEQVSLEYESNSMEIEQTIISEPKVNYNEERIEGMPLMHPIGSLFGTYIICQNELGMYLIDQHAAKERINYEKYKKKLGIPSKETTSLLIPLTLEFSNDEFLILKENISFLNNMGFLLEHFGYNSLIVKEHPLWLPQNYEATAIKKILELVILYEKDFNLEKFNEEVAINLSCRLAIKANEYISQEEMEQLISDLRNCRNPYNCPHGRPTTIYYSKYEIEKMFKRTGI